MLAASVRCWLWRMRRRGERLPVHLVDEPMEVDLLASNEQGLRGDSLVVRACSPGDPTSRRHQIHDAQIIRTGVDAMLLRGNEWDAGLERQWVQTWLCTATLGRGQGILGTMSWRRASE